MSRTAAQIAASKARNDRFRESIAAKEPNFSDLKIGYERYNWLMADCLSWLNEIFSYSDLKDFTLSYVKENELNFKHLDKVPEFEFMQVGKMFYILSKGGELTERIANKNNETLKILEAKGEKISKKEEMKSLTKKAPRDPARELADDIQDMIILGNSSNDELADVIFASNLNQIEANAFVNRIKEFLADWESDDAQCVEMQNLAGDEKTAYFREHYRNVITIAGMFSENIKATRKASKKNKTFKEQRTERKVKNIKTKKIDTTYNIVSLPAEEIIGAKTLLTFNTKNRRLGYYVAVGEEGLSVKGSTILNYDNDKSFSKIVRNPERDLQAFRNAKNDRRIEVLITENIKGVSHTLTGRLNSETVILKVFK